MLECLRLGAYQILFLDRVPDRAAVNESVNLARKYAKNPRSAGLVNGVLRGLVRQKESLPPPPDAAVQYSHPQWLADEFVRRLGREEAQALMAADNAQPPTMAQVNTGKASTAAAAERLRDEGVGVAPPSLACRLSGAVGYRQPGAAGVVPGRAFFTFRTLPPGWRCWPRDRNPG